MSDRIHMEIIDAICDGIWFASDKTVCVSRTWVSEALLRDRFARDWKIVPRYAPPSTTAPGADGGKR